jgi:hypothetical protein
MIMFAITGSHSVQNAVLHITLLHALYANTLLYDTHTQPWCES